MSNVLRAPIADLSDTDPASRIHQVIAVCGAAGGVGATSLAVNLGCILASDREDGTVLVDLDLPLGDSDILLDTIADYTLADAVNDLSRLDSELLKRSLVQHASGLFLLPQSARLDESAIPTPDDLQRLLSVMKAAFSCVVLDLSTSYGALDRVALEMADQVLLVTQLELPCLRNAVRLLAWLDAVNGIGDKVKVIVNRVSSPSGPITVRKAREMIGREVFWQLPDDYRTMSGSRNSGVPLAEYAPSAAITQSIRELAAELKPKSRAREIAMRPTPALRASIGP